ncbi:hypothetical protein SAMN05216420_10645 [Nitrosospira sp. Nl5]|uniref:hypothetical protein n=1 Tax=Nitrosospira sp. Nl5 TaxID=200120 RepID=UPI0008843850|nr:hypothetical protein [Nitrosospira sp. Nl5]SCY42636.1 hypothetical protein SAMN05216420_10645 [Nitrosospira sp. Nl5]
MDVFYYWKDYKNDIENDMVGRFVSTSKKLEEMNQCPPDYIWAFKTPEGRKGQVQLIARLWWAKTEPQGLKPSEKINIGSVMYYQPSDPRSILYNNTDSDEAITHVTELLKTKFPAAFRSNFHGENGVHALDSNFLTTFYKEIAQYSGTQFRSAVARVLLSK